MSGIEGLLVGRVLGGRYRIEEVIGRGGMGAVYRAVDERLGREVALKVITVAGTGDVESRERLRARFFREARSAAALPHHPNVVPVYDYGTDEALGLDYLVMELLRGSDLATRLSRTGAPPLAASLKILVEAARGLAVGHRQGLIHRDVKPGNIFLAQTHNNEVQVRVVDFGIAKVADEEDTLAQLTQDGRVPHSPAYASPEQLRGLTNLTPASDVFSLGAVGFELLTRERPFSESDRNRMSLGMPVEPPSVRALNPAVPSSAEAVIRKALAYDPSQRFRDAGEMGEALEQAIRSIADTTVDPYLAGAPIVTAAQAKETRPFDDADDDRTQLAPVADDHTLLAPPPPATVRPRESTRLPPERAVAPARGGDGRRRRGVGGVIVWGLVIALLLAAGLWGWSELGGNGGVALDEPPPPPDSLPIIVPDDRLDAPQEPTPLDAFINDRDGRAFYQRGQYDSARIQFQRAVQIEPDNPEYRRNYGLSLLMLGLAAEAEREFRRAIELSPSQPLPYINLADAQLAQGDTLAAMASIEQYLQRETRPREAGIAERRLRDLRASRQSRLPPLLGDTTGLGPAPESSSPAPDSIPAGSSPDDSQGAVAPQPGAGGGTILLGDSPPSAPTPQAPRPDSITPAAGLPPQG